MKVSLKWLAEFFPHLKDEGLAPHFGLLRERLPLSGLEIGSWKSMAEGIGEVVVGQIISFEKHPNADRLSVCKVSDGSKEMQIVCGAPNVKAGVKVALAREGTVLPGDFKIKRSKIRDVESCGMLCSEKELGLSEESQGILHLPAAAALGSPLTKALGLNDFVAEIELTPDRSDCLSHLGVAREVGRLINAKLVLPEFDNLLSKDTGDVPLLSVEVKEPKACPIYSAQLFEGIQNRPSPEWLKRRLESLGHRSHNLVVDITNDCLFELGHPLHAFDADKIVGSKIIVRFARAGEKIKTLDEMERTLTAEDLVIADLERPLALAGVMGGLDSGVTEATKRVVLESAVFDAEAIRSMAKRHKIHSEASHRFERGVDAANYARAAGRFSHLLRQLADARRRGAITDIRSDKAEKLFQKHVLNFDLRAFKDVVAIDAAPEEIAKALQSVGIEAQTKSQNVLKVEVPTHRLDLVREIDLVEESARLLGYNRIPERYPAQLNQTAPVTTPLYWQLRQLRRRLLETGLCEMMPYVFISEREKARVPGAKLVELENPLSQDWQFLRPTLAFGLINVVARHAALGQMNGRFFDCGAVFERKDVAAGDQRATGCAESWHASWALMGNRLEENWSSDKKSADRKAPVDFFDAKGVAETLIGGLTALEPRWAGTQFVGLLDFPKDALAQQAPWIPVQLLHPGRSAILVWPGKPPGQIVGYVGELHPSLKGDFLNLATGLQLGVALGEIRVIEDVYSKPVVPSPLPARGSITLSRRLPIVERDMALVVKADVKAGELARTLRKAVGPELLDLKCVDLFVLPDGSRSLAFRVCLQGPDKTLGDEEITATVKKMIAAASDKHGAQLRS